MSKRAVIALGGNAILTDDPSAKGQIEVIKKSVQELMHFIEAGYEIVITHGNGPQVGNLLIQQQLGSSANNPEMPLDTAVAMTQGSIGYWLEIALRNELNRKGINKEVTSVITQIRVDEMDPNFNRPSKPIGPFLTEAEAEIKRNKGETIVEDAGRGYRKVVPSPMPIEILNKTTIQTFIEAGNIVIAGGGGGIPVVKRNQEYVGVEGVIDKDFASALMSKTIDADELIILTGVDYVTLNFNTPAQENLHRVHVDEIKEYIKENHFAKGSMLPKVEAALFFLQDKPNSEVVITSLNNLNHFFESRDGTIIYN